jgi:predicted nucleotidyltransferase
MAVYDDMVRIILQHYPTAQAIYLFGSYGTPDEWPSSDVDIAILLPPLEAKRADAMAFSEACVALGRLLRKDVDLVNLRQVSTVFQKEIVMADRRIHCADAYAADEFEMLTLSFYQKLNEERAEVLAEGLRSGRFYNV